MGGAPGGPPLCLFVSLLYCLCLLCVFVRFLSLMSCIRSCYRVIYHHLRVYRRSVRYEAELLAGGSKKSVAGKERGANVCVAGCRREGHMCCRT